MRLVLRALLVLPLLLLLATALALWLALESAPSVAPRDEVSHDDVARAIAILKANDPRSGPAGARHTLSISPRDLDLLLNHGARRLFGGRVFVGLEHGAATINVSVPVPQQVPLAGGTWLNAQVHVTEAAALPQLQSVAIGRLPVPAWLALPLARVAAHGLGHGGELALATQALAMVHRVSFFPRRVSVSYFWDPGAPKRLLANLVDQEEQQRLRHYHDALVATAQRQAGRGHVALGALLAPLFELARQRAGSGQDAAAENRAAVLTATVYALGRSLGGVVPAAREWPAPAPLRVRLSGREDFALHFLVSATIAIDGTSPLSKAVGIYKEVADSRGGSGFSFNDLAADRAGTRLGEVALAQARTTQDRLAAGVADDQLMPRWDDLPEFLNEAEFRRRFGGVGAPEYNRLVAEIDRRVGELAALR
jgi:hypothetical protein